MPVASRVVARRGPRSGADLSSQMSCSGVADHATFLSMRNSTNHTDLHCSNCGTTDTEDLTTGDQGYTACCNEPVCSDDCGDGSTCWNR